MKRAIMIPPSEKQKEKRVLRVAAYCRVSTKHEEQDGSLELQKDYFERMIAGTPNWVNAGIYLERATGLDVHKRPAFLKFLKACEKGRVDLILMKSISRFGRNTLDMLRAIQKLRDQGIDVYFDQERMWLHEQPMQFLLTAYFAFAQQESEDISASIRWGIQRGFREGRSGYSDFTCYGYKTGDDGRLAVDLFEASVVKTIFEMRATGASLGKISDWLHQYGISSPTGKERWSRETIRKILKNEKYIGDVILQKTFVGDLFSGKQVKNIGQRNRYLIQNHHPAIISRELFEAVTKNIFKTE